MPSFPLICAVVLLLAAGISAEERFDARGYFGYFPEINDTTFTNQTLLAEEFLFAHNWVRKQYNLAPYVWDENLASFARGYLMQRYEDCQMIHSSSITYGENMFWGKKRYWTPSDAIYYWYLEKDWFDFNTLTCSTSPSACKHFTQMVWRDSRSVGCGLQNCHDPLLGMLIACEYYPPGNYPHENPLQAHEPPPA